MDKSDIDRIIVRGRDIAREQMITEHQKIQAAMKAEIEARQRGLREKVCKHLENTLEGQVINAIKTACKQVNVYCGEDREFALAVRDYLRETGYEVNSVDNSGSGKVAYGQYNIEYSVYLTLPPAPGALSATDFVCLECGAPMEKYLYGKEVGLRCSRHIEHHTHYIEHHNQK
jgi:hypothetical protein